MVSMWKVLLASLLFSAVKVRCDEPSFASLQAEIAELRAQVSALRDAAAAQSDGAGSGPDGAGSATAAFMTTIAEWSTNYTDDDIVGFNEIIFDTADAFDPNTGAYVAPLDGVYMFYMKVGGFINGDSPSDDNPIGNSYNLEIVIQVDGVDIANSNAFDGRDYLRNAQMTYALSLARGQQVTVKVRSTEPGDAGYITVQGIQGQNFKTISWFGGHLLL